MSVSCEAPRSVDFDPNGISQDVPTRPGNSNLSEKAFVDELASRIDELRSHVETNNRLLSGFRVEISPLLRQLKANQQAAPFSEQRSLQDIRVTCTAVREIERTLSHHVQELDVLKRNCARTVEDLKRRVGEDTVAVERTQDRQTQILREVRDIAERKAREPWILSWLLSPFRAKEPAQEVVDEARRDAMGARTRLQEGESQLRVATEELRGTLMRRIELNRFLARLGPIRANVEDVLEAIAVQNSSVHGAPPVSTAPFVEPPRDYRFSITIPSTFFDECVRLSRGFSADVSRQVQARLAETRAKNLTGFSSNDAATTELHYMLGDIRRIIQGSENDLVRFILRAFAEMVEDAI